MVIINKEQVESVLNSVQDAAGNISAVTVNGTEVGFIIENHSALTSEQLLALKFSCERAVTALGASRVLAIVTEDITGKAASGQQVVVRSEPKKHTVPPPPTPKPLDGIRHVILVAAGKGGVGKSTISTNFAVALAQSGLKVGLVDADIHGPSIARMMKLNAEPDIQHEKMLPTLRYGVKCLSMGAFMREDVPVVWRGPMVTKAVTRLLRDAHWGTLDVLVVDMPPGTGDIALSLAQNIQASGVLIVSTPQEVALLDVRKAINFYQKINVPVLGVIENMGFIQLPSGETMFPYGKGNVKAMCYDADLSYLGAIPILPEISNGGDTGKPVACEKGILQDLFLDFARQAYLNHPLFSKR